MTIYMNILKVAIPIAVKGSLNTWVRAIDEEQPSHVTFASMNSRRWDEGRWVIPK